MNANILLDQNVCKPRFLFFDANASYKDAKVHMMHIPPYQYADATFYDANVPYRDANTTFIFLNAKFPFTELQIQLFYDANFSCRNVNAKFIHDDANASLRRCKCKSHFFFGIKCPLWVCHDVNALLWVCHDVNALLWVCHDVNAPLWVCHDTKCFLLDANAI